MTKLSVFPPSNFYQPGNGIDEKYWIVVRDEYPDYWKSMLEDVLYQDRGIIEFERNQSGE